MSKGEKLKPAEILEDQTDQLEAVLALYRSHGIQETNLTGGLRRTFAILEAVQSCAVAATTLEVVKFPFSRSHQVNFAEVSHLVGEEADDAIKLLAYAEGAVLDDYGCGIVKVDLSRDSSLAPELSGFGYLIVDDIATKNLAGQM